MKNINTFIALCSQENVRIAGTAKQIEFDQRRMDFGRGLMP